MSFIAGTFAVVEKLPGANQVLVLLDTAAEAEAIAIELRGRGMKVEVQQGPA
jgi:hypothetical protein